MITVPASSISSRCAMRAAKARASAWTSAEENAESAGFGVEPE